MHRIKLNAIGSTNTFLKELSVNREVNNYTVVTAESQFGGRGQMGTKWDSVEGENLLFSVFVRFESLFFKDFVYLNYAVSLTLYEVLKAYNIEGVSVKWPNDILAGNQKICGILIENTLKKSQIVSSVIGIGLNVNQIIFSEALKGATSLKRKLGKEIDREILLKKIMDTLRLEISKCTKKNFVELKERYLQVLYKKDIPTMFKDSRDTVFMGKIIDVSEKGKLRLMLDDETIKEFELKEIQMLK